jgi:hypothetical protein
MSPRINDAYGWLNLALSVLLLGYVIYKYVLAVRNHRLVNFYGLLCDVTTN